MGSFGVARGHPSRSLKIASFDRVRIQFLLAFHIHVYPYLALFLRYNEILVENRRLEPTPPLFGAPVEVISLECRRDFWHKYYESMDYRMTLFV